MSQESSTPDLVALTQAMGAAKDVEATMSFFGPDPVWDGSPLGLEIYEGRDAIRESLEDWIEIYDDHEEDDEEILDLGNGVVFSATRLSGHPRSAGPAGRIHGVYGFVIVWAGGEISRVTVYPDVDEARAAAERLAESRGQAMSQENVEIVRRVMRRFVEQDMDGALSDIDPEAELDWSNSDAPDSGVYRGHAGWRSFAQARDEVLGGRGFDFTEVVAPAHDTVVVIGRMREQGRVSGVEVAAQGAAVFTLHEGKVTCLKLYQSGNEALNAVGLAE